LNLRNFDGLIHLFTIRRLAGKQKSLHKFTFTAKCETREPFEPSASRNFWIGRKPMIQQLQVGITNSPFLRPIKQVPQDRAR
jgi:hypothetical protein